MRETFGVAWLDKLGTEPSDTWIEELGQLQLPAIRAALRKLRHHQVPYPGWVPSLLDFLAFVRGAEVTRLPPDVPSFQGDNIDFTANRLMMHYLWRKGGASKESSSQLWKIARKLSADYRLILSEEKVTNGEFQDALEAAWNKVWEPHELSPTKEI